MNNYTFGNYICEHREKVGLSQSQLGEKLGVSNKAVSKWENGGSYPSSELMLPLAKALNVTIEDLYTALTNSKKEKGRMRKILDFLSEKSNIIILTMLSLNLIFLALFLILGDHPDKFNILISSIIISPIVYGMIRLMFFIFKKNPMCPSKYIDFMSLFFMFGAGIGLFIIEVIEFITLFPNGFNPGFFVSLSLISAILHSNKKRL